MNITKPIIRKIKDNETALAEFEKEIKTNEAEDTKDIIMNFPRYTSTTGRKRISMMYMSGNQTISLHVRDSIIITESNMKPGNIECCKKTLRFISSDMNISINP